MSMTVPQNFATLFTSEVHHLYQQKGSVLRGRVRNRTITGNEKARFHRLAAGVATTKARHADVPLQDLTHDYVEVSVAPYFAAEMIDDMDQAQTNVSLRMEYATALANAMGRAIDDVIITNLATTTTTEIGNYGSRLTFDYIRELHKRMNEAELPKEGRKIVIGAEQEYDFFGLLTATGNHPITTSSDFVSDRPLESGQMPKTFMGFEWILSNRLPVPAANQRRCFAWQESAVALAWSRDVTPSFDWLPLKHGWLVKSAMQLGSKTIEDAGVIPLHLSEA